MPTISLAMIVRNEEATLGRCLESVARHVDEVIIVDTGSTDSTKAIAARHGAKVIDCNPETHPQHFFMDDESTGAPPPYSREMTLGNFGAARNVAFEAATGDYVLWLDADDVLEGGEHLRTASAEMAARGVETVWMIYNYAQDDRGRTVCQLERERIIRKGSSSWKNRIHEVLLPIQVEKSVRSSTMVVHHRRPIERAAGVANRNFKVLLLQMKEDPNDARTLFYFGNEARFLDQDKAIDAYERYIELSGWPEERAVARTYLGELYEQRGKVARAFTCYAAATVEFPQLPDSWFGLGRLAFHRKDWAECCRFNEEGFKKGNPGSVIMFNPLARTYAPYLNYNVALSSSGRVQEALEACGKGLEAVPEDPHLTHNAKAYRKYLDDLADPVNQLLANPKTPQHVKDAVARSLEANRPVEPPVRVFPKVEDELSIVVWTGPAVEPWSPNSPKTTGIGGSETAAIEMCRHLAAMGHKVVVYSECTGAEGVHDGVEYAHFSTFSGVDCDVFISSRQPAIADMPIKAGLKILWVHDTHVGQPQPAMHRLLLKFDRYLCLSEWHRALFLKIYPFLHPSMVLVTRNGLDPARFAGEMPAKKNKLVFSSSANRGLDVMLDVFPRIRAQVPDAELHVFYGFETWERSARLMNSQAELQEIEAYKRRLAQTEGVVWRGRVDQDTLAREMMESKVWSYPTAFTETYCITAIESQAAACVPVTSHLAGLAETAKWGVQLDGQNTSAEYQDEFVKQVVQLLQDDERRETVATLAREWALTLSWESIAKEWVELFARETFEAVMSIVPRYETMMGKAA